MRGREIAILAVAFLAVQLPFLGQALVIDDGSFVDQGLQILENPARPYSFDIRFEVVTPFFEYFANPPGMAYWLALPLGLFGRAEPMLHLSVLLLSALAVFVTYLLGRAWIGEGLFPALLVLATPAFALSSHTVMADVPATAFYLLALYLFVRGVDEQRTGALVGAGLAAGVATLFKYSALSVFPLMLLYLVLRRSWQPRSYLPPAIGVAIFAAWCLASRLAYGGVHLAAAFEVQAGGRDLVAHVVQIAAVMTGLGGTTIFPPLLLVWCVRLNFLRGASWGWSSVMLSVAAFGLSIPAWDHPLLTYTPGNRLLGGLLLAAGAATLLFLVGRGTAALADWREARHHASDARPARRLLLVTWCLGFLALNAWTLFATSKYLIPALAPLVLLLIDASTAGGRRIRAPTFRGSVLVSTVALALVLSGVMASQAAGHRRTVEVKVPELAQGRPVWFVGHWTIRYYSEHAGFRHLGTALDAESVPAPRDVAFVVGDAVWHALPAELQLGLLGEHSEPARVPIHVANQFLRAGFWSHLTGVMPYVVSTEPRTVTQVYWIAG